MPRSSRPAAPPSSRRALAGAAVLLAAVALAPRAAAAQPGASTQLAAGAATVRGADASRYATGWLVDLSTQSGRPQAPSRLGRADVRVAFTYARFGDRPLDAPPAPGLAVARRPLGYIAFTVGAVLGGPQLGRVATYALGGGGFYGQSGPGVATQTLGLQAGAGARVPVRLGRVGSSLFAEWRAENLTPVALSRRPIAPPRYQPLVVGLRF